MPKFLIAADVGNSSTKISVGDCDDMRFVSDRLVFQSTDPISIDFPEPAERTGLWSICSVSKSRCAALMTWIKKNRPQDAIHVIGQRDVELPSCVESRESTGCDRLVAAYMAARIAEQGSPFIVVDAGTAVTIDFVSADRILTGGVIFPGAVTQLKQLAATTDALPDLSAQTELTLAEIFSDVVGASTNAAILKGVFHAQHASIVSIVERMIQKNAVGDVKCEVFATGGGIEAMRDFLPEHWNIVPNLVLQGAFSIGAQVIKSMADDS